MKHGGTTTLKKRAKAMKIVLTRREVAVVWVKELQGRLVARREAKRL